MSSNSNEPPPSNPVLEAYEKFVQETPFVTRSILLTLAVSYLASWFFDPQYALGNMLQFTIFEFEVYRILLSPLVNDSFFSLLFAFLSFQPLGQRLEYSMGSAAFGWLCLMMGFWTNILFLILSLLLCYATNDWSYGIISSSGIWIILFGVMALECLRAPRGTPRRLFCYDVPVQYYPLALYAVFALVGGRMLWGQLISMGLGYVLGLVSSGESTVSIPGGGLLERMVLIGSAKSKDLEDRYLSSLCSRPGWVVSHSATGTGAWSEDAGSGGMQMVRNL